MHLILHSRLLRELILPALTTFFMISISKRIISFQIKTDYTSADIMAEMCLCIIQQKIIPM